MSDCEIEQSLAEKLNVSVVVPQTKIEPVDDARKSFNDEKRFYAERHVQDILDRHDARGQRRHYAKRVFILVCVWITAIFVLLGFQVFGTWITPLYKPLSDGVLIALISSTTVNLIGTLIVVLKYIFRLPGADSSKT